MTTRAVDLTVDVTEAAGLGPAHTVVTVVLPDVDTLTDPPVVCFGLPGGGYSRRYFTFDMPGSSGGGQAGYHAERGWIFVACDHLGVGDSTTFDPDPMTYEIVASATKATVDAVMSRLASGTVAEGFPAVTGAVTLGIGQSMGGCFTLVTQAHHQPWDGIALLGSSAVHTRVPAPPGSPPIPMPWVARTSRPDALNILNARALATATAVVDGQDALTEMATAGANPFQWAFHWEDVPADVVTADMAAMAGGPIPAWRSATVPACAIMMVTPGTTASEAAAVTTPVLLAMGERDVVPDPWMEPKAFGSSRDITLYVCPTMAHMHNFAGTRERFWARAHHWGIGVAAS